MSGLHKPYLLLVSPEESPTFAWEFVEFETEEEAHAEVKKRNLSKEHYIAHKDAFVSMLRNYFVEVPEMSKLHECSPLEQQWLSKEIATLYHESEDLTESLDPTYSEGIKSDFSDKFPDSENRDKILGIIKEELIKMYTPPRPAFITDAKQEFIDKQVKQTVAETSDADDAAEYISDITFEYEDEFGRLYDSDAVEFNSYVETLLRVQAEAK